ncbi:hypothetical protein ICW40_07380 [Actinotalea ferrariae]|uniref:DUF6545 domain-containing protein n=1 Tax=Actinotalea ferrariae TaxID=1386098 RepID=UPI001C8C52CC|nr:DUF6545 domain-containing protein [Actinotalea ferrariae]MBX9244630.1 hypothetical protein [Actinotalea ferrariae]
MGSWTPVEVLTLPGVVLLWILVLVRTRGALYGGSRRLAAILLTLVTAMTIRLSFVGRLIDDTTGVVGLEVLVRNSLGIVMAVCAALAVADVVRDRPVSRRMAQIWSGVAALAIVSMGLAFLAAGTEREGLDEMGVASGRPAALTYWTIYIVAYGGFVTAVAVMAARNARQPGAWTRSRRGLLFFGLGAAATDVYLAAKAVVLAAAVAGQYEHPFVANAVAVQAVPSAVAIMFIVLGAAAWTQLHLRARWLHRRLEGPWEDLTRPVPAVVLDPPLRHPPARLNRRMHELREAAALLASHLTPADAEAARRLDAGAPYELVLLEIARNRAVAEQDQVPRPLSVHLTLPDNPRSLVKFFASRRRAQRVARTIEAELVGVS